MLVLIQSPKTEVSASPSYRRPMLKEELAHTLRMLELSDAPTIQLPPEKYPA